MSVLSFCSLGKERTKESNMENFFLLNGKDEIIIAIAFQTTFLSILRFEHQAKG